MNHQQVALDFTRNKAAHIRLQQQHLFKEEEVLVDQQLCQLKRNSNLDQKEPEPPHIKEEPEDLCISQDEEQPDNALQRQRWPNCCSDDPGTAGNQGFSQITGTSTTLPVRGLTESVLRPPGVLVLSVFRMVLDEVKQQIQKSTFQTHRVWFSFSAQSLWLNLLYCLQTSRPSCILVSYH
ncbi:hypothetical protein CHARACLAT_029127 [Characodon lateralis]|uniref:Uncharacterized protein n=1 Tax=Characodon lateralis TaxID=208331 RepID=A0ABU7EXP6_9TELE|nr:hypothetical protein [Characodon lateralis]